MDSVLFRRCFRCPFSQSVSLRLSAPLRCSNVRAASTKSIPFHGGARPGNSSCRFTGVLASAVTAFLDPTRADAVAALGEYTGHVALTQMYHRMLDDSTGQRILSERPTVSNQTMPVVPKPGSFGEAYVEFMKHHRFHPDERDDVRFIEDRDLAFVMLRYRQCHDFWHVLTGLAPTVLGELGLKWLELLQTGLPVAALSATVGSLRLDSNERNILGQHYLPWAVQMSQESTYLLNVYYEEEFDTPFSVLRDRLKIKPAPIATERDDQTPK